MQEATHTDEILVYRVVQRDVDAFATLYDRYARAVYTLAAHMLGTSEAEEIVQEVFLRLWTRANQYDHSKGPFNSWLFAIARHRVLDELQRRNQQQRPIDAERIEYLLATSTDVEEQASLNERSESLIRALKELPEEQRRVLVLSYFGGLSQSAMANRLGWPLGTVKKRTKLAMQKLRRALDNEGSVVGASGKEIIEVDGGYTRSMPVNWNEREFDILLQNHGLSDQELASQLLQRTSGAVGTVRSFIHNFHIGGNVSGLSKMMIKRLQEKSIPVVCPRCGTQF